MIPCTWCWVSCDHPVTLETRVREDGSFGRSIVFEKTDSSVLRGNMFGVSEASGWKVTVQAIEGDDDKDRYRIGFEKNFSSAEEMNAELDPGSDTLFRIRSSCEKQLRWFYTYIRYEETYRPINRFRLSPAEEFFNEEDRQFIRRLPPEGTPLDKPDSIFLANLDNKIGDHYVVWSIFNEQMDILKKLVIRGGLESRWLDTLKKHEDLVYESIDDDKGDERFAMRMADTLGIPLPKGAGRWADSLSADFNARLRFMSFAHDSRFRIVYELPWTVVETNADSIAGNRAYWRPRTHKFMFNDYTMYAEARMPNALAMIMGGLLVVIALFVFFRKGILRNR